MSVINDLSLKYISIYEYGIAAARLSVLNATEKEHYIGDSSIRGIVIESSLYS